MKVDMSNVFSLSFMFIPISQQASVYYLSYEQTLKFNFSSLTYL